MGSCISKCKPKKKSKEEDPCRHVHDKLVISKDPPPVAPEITILPSDKPRSPAPSTSSTASFSSFSYSANSKSAVASSISSSSSLSSSSSYSTSALKDRSFSNDFLCSCAKENPHAVGLNVEKTVIFPNKIRFQNLDPLIREKTLTKKAAAPTPKKRARAASPTLMRQKSFRREQSFVVSTPNRGVRSPSPSRRFNGESNGRSPSPSRRFNSESNGRSPSPSRRFNGESNRIFPVKESYYRKPVVSRGNSAVSSTPKRESFRAPTPSGNGELSIGGESSVRKNDAFSKHISSKIDDKEKDDDVVMEDINNPLIALDCFIFL